MIYYIKAGNVLQELSQPYCAFIMYQKNMCMHDINLTSYMYFGDFLDDADQYEELMILMTLYSKWSI